jgi:quercetin dioxygenase-like cupin family protein
LKSDEVPAILQTKERVLSRNQNEDLVQTLNEIKSGASGPREVHHHPVYIQAVDPQSFASLAAKNHEGIANALGINYQSNGISRKLIKSQP